MNKHRTPRSAETAQFRAASDNSCLVNNESVGRLPQKAGAIRLPQVAWRGQASIVSRFWDRVEKTQTCWLWRGLVVARYGQISLGHPSSPGGKRWKAHRFSWELHYGPIPEGMNVCHRCDVPICVNPEHLFLGSQKTNVHDAIRKGRRNAFGRQKLHPDDIRIIRAQAARGILHKDIASAFRVSRSCISTVVNRASWAHLGDDHSPDSVVSGSPTSVERRGREC